MEIMWLGQGGLLFASGKKKILVDPYLSDSLRKIDRSLKRRFRVNKKLYRVVPDIIVLTNSHPDHTDVKTVSKYLSKKTKTKITVLSCENSFRELVEIKECAKANHIMFSEGDEWTLENLHLKAVKARTDDRSAFGLVITDSTDGKVYYIASNTLYNKAVLEDAPKEPYCAFVPISGAFGCMNMADALRFAEQVNAEFVIPINYGMFDTINASKEFVAPGKIIPRPYKPVEFNLLNVQSLFTPKVFDSKFNEKVKKKKGKEVEEPVTTGPTITDEVYTPPTEVTVPKTEVTTPKTEVVTPKPEVTTPVTTDTTTEVKTPLVDDFPTEGPIPTDIVGHGGIGGTGVGAPMNTTPYTGGVSTEE
ncbi:MAG: MBL fold metallo-hydrolase [Clostridia bacterium]|nr:MBL fold metallo-hydrolase [Clostridia bacterium]